MAHFDNQGVKGGLWRGRLTGLETRPARVVLLHHGEIVARARLSEDGPDAWQIEVPLPPEVLADGVQTLLLKADDGAEDEESRADGILLARLSVMAGRTLDDDLTAEIAALRAELDMVKRELRRFAASAPRG